MKKQALLLFGLLALFGGMAEAWEYDFVAHEQASSFNEAGYVFNAHPSRESIEAALAEPRTAVAVPIIQIPFETLAGTLESKSCVAIFSGDINKPTEWKLFRISCDGAPGK